MLNLWYLASLVALLCCVQVCNYILWCYWFLCYLIGNRKLTQLLYTAHSCQWRVHCVQRRGGSGKEWREQHVRVYCGLSPLCIGGFVFLLSPPSSPSSLPSPSPSCSRLFFASLRHFHLIVHIDYYHSRTSTSIYNSSIHHCHHHRRHHFLPSSQRWIHCFSKLTANRKWLEHNGDCRTIPQCHYLGVDHHKCH